MAQGVCRTQAENHPIRPLETAEGLEQLLDWHGLIKNKQKKKPTATKETKKPTLGSLEMGGNSLFSTQLGRGVSQSVSVLSSAALSAVTGLVPVSKATFGGL